MSDQDHNQLSQVRSWALSLIVRSIYPLDLTKINIKYHKSDPELCLWSQDQFILSISPISQSKILHQILSFVFDRKIRSSSRSYQDHNQRSHIRSWALSLIARSVHLLDLIKIKIKDHTSDPELCPWSQDQFILSISPGSKSKITPRILSFVLDRKISSSSRPHLDHVPRSPPFRAGESFTEQ